MKRSVNRIMHIIKREMKTGRKVIASIFLAFMMSGLLAQAVVIDNVILTPTVCSDGNEGEITFTIRGGTPPYNWSILPQTIVPPVASGIAYSDTTITVSGLSGALYFLLVSDSNTPITTDERSFTIPGPDPIEIKLEEYSDLSCNNADDGSIRVSATGESESFDFTLAGPDPDNNTSGIFTGLLPGDYTVTATDATGCITSDVTEVITLLNPDPISLVLDELLPAGCYGTNTGSISITPEGGTPSGSGTGYEYSWRGPDDYSSTDEDITDLYQGEYYVTIRDGQSCSEELGPYTITESSQIQMSLLNFDHVTCHGAANGSASIDVTEGAGDYTFSWVGAINGEVSTLEDPNNLLADTYELTITDVDGCYRLFSPMFTLTEPDTLGVGSVITPVDCNSNTTGAIEVTVSGGTTPYNFSWELPDGSLVNSQNLSNIPAGDYTLTVTDANSCIFVTDPVTVTEPEPLLVGSDKTDISCNGAGDGSITVTVSGATPPYLLTWTGPPSFSGSGETISNLEAGDYQLRIEDANGCIYVDAVIESIAEPLAITAILDGQVDIACFGDSTGAIDITASNGTLPYIFDWTNGAGKSVSSDEDPSGLPEDSYSLHITDANGCEAEYDPLTTLSEAPLLTTALAATNISCFGEADGSITASSSGGTGSYQYSIDGGPLQASGVFSIAIAGLYTIVTLDDAGCSKSDTITVYEPTEILPGSESMAYLCHGDNGGEISMGGASGGTGPYEYSIDNGSTYQDNGDFSGLAPGSYQIWIRDASGCIAYGTTHVLTEPDEILIDSYSQSDITTCYNEAVGEVDITAIGGTIPLSFTIDGGTPQDNGHFTLLAAGNHDIHISDANGCPLDTTIEILAPDELVIVVLSSNITGCHGDETGIISISALGGTLPLEYSLDGITYQATGGYIDLPAGDYTAYVKDANDCEVSQSVTLTQPDELLADIDHTNLGFGTLGSITISNTRGGTKPYVYSIDGPGGSFTSDTVYTDLDVGTYEIVVRDANGCTYPETIEILDIIPLNMLFEISHISCAGVVDGSIRFLPQSDAVGVVDYSIDNGVTFVTDPFFDGLLANTYQVVAIDEEGKLYTGQIDIIEPPELLVSQTVNDAECNAFSPTGSIELDISGGWGVYSINWSDGSTEQNRYQLNTGSYQVQVMDENSCTVDLQFDVGSDISITANAGEDQEVCNGSSITLDGQGNGDPTWDSSPLLSQTDILDPVAGPMNENTDFVLTISESISPFGCYNRDTVSISVLPMQGLDAGLDTFVIRGNSVELTALGSGFSDYLWAPAESLDDPAIYNPMATPMDPTMYRVYANNEFGCEESDSVFVDVIENIRAHNVFTPNGDGYNEYFEIVNADRFPGMIVEVFTRAGKQIFSSKGYAEDQRWDGTYNQGEAPLGTYYFVIIPYSGAKAITGHVTIVR